MGVRGWNGDEALDSGMRARRSLAETTIPLVKYLPKKFNMRSVIDPSLCVHIVNLTSSPEVDAARARSGLPPTDPADIAAHGASRLVLLKCSGSHDSAFLAERLDGRSYTLDAVYAFDKAFIKPAYQTGSCLYGVNASYTAGHPVWGYDSSTEFDPEDPMDWFDDYRFEYAPYLSYNYNITALNLTSSQAIHIPDSMFDASGWGPFHTSYGPCMENPTIDRPIPIVPDEVLLNYMGFAIIGPQGEDLNFTCLEGLNSSSAVKQKAYVLTTFGPERPRWSDLDPVFENSNGYDGSFLISVELCLTADVVKEGALLTLEQCLPSRPAIDQVWSLQAHSLSTASSETRRARPRPPPRPPTGSGY